MELLFKKIAVRLFSPVQIKFRQKKIIWVVDVNVNPAVIQYKRFDVRTEKTIVLQCPRRAEHGRDAQ